MVTFALRGTSFQGNNDPQPNTRSGLNLSLTAELDPNHDPNYDPNYDPNSRTLTMTLTAGWSSHV